MPEVVKVWFRVRVKSVESEVAEVVVKVKLNGNDDVIKQTSRISMKRKIDVIEEMFSKCLSS